MNKRKTGRPTKFNPAMVKLICDTVSDGVPITVASAIAGVSLEWICQHRRKHPDFDRKIREATSAAIQSRLAIVKRAMESADESIALRSATWWLTHAPGAAEIFSESRRVELTGADGAPLAAGVTLYLPRKDVPIVETDNGDGEVKAIAERSGEDAPD